MKLKILAFYEDTQPVTSPPTYVVDYELLFNSTDAAPSKVLIWGPQGVYTDIIPASGTVFTANENSITRSLLLTQAGSYTPLVPPGLLGVIPAGGTKSAQITLQPGTYNLVVTTSSGSVTASVNGFSVTAAFTVDEMPLQLILSSTAGATVTGVTITPQSISFLDITAPTYILAVDGSYNVLDAVQITQVAPQTGSPQTRSLPIVITELDSNLNTIVAAAEQPSSELNN